MSVLLLSDHDGIASSSRTSFLTGVFGCTAGFFFGDFAGALNLMNESILGVVDF